MLSRRELIRAAGVVAGSVALTPLVRAQTATPAAGEFKLNPLPYAFDALEPILDAETMEIHHDKHQAAYVSSLNTFLAASAPAMLGKTAAEVCQALDQIPEAARTSVRNNAGGVWNHEFFWSVMAKPGSGGQPSNELMAAIDKSFDGGLDTLKTGLVLAGTSRFGSGWAWLVIGKDKPLAITHTPNQDNPLMTGSPAPLLGVDVWEHAYYLKYRNLRKNYLEEWVKLINWNQVNENFNALAKR